MKINLGAGNDKREGYVSLDKAFGADILCDIEDGIPLEDDSCEEIIAMDVLEQMSTAKKFVFVMNQLHRIMKKDGKLFIRVPNAKDICAFQDPMDSRRFTDETFTYLQYAHPRYKEYGINYGFKPWKLDAFESDHQIKLCITPVK